MDFGERDFTVLGPKVEEPRGGVVEWSDQLETGIDVLDQQHRRYVDLLNDYLAKAADYRNTQQQAEQLVESFNFLRGYAQEHFETEDAIMREIDYPDFDAHYEQHQHFIEHVEGLSRRMESEGFSAGLSREVNFYAIEWFVDHILGSDMQLVHYLKEKNLEHKAEAMAS